MPIGFFYSGDIAPALSDLGAKGCVENGEVEPHLLDDWLDDANDFFCGSSAEDLCLFDQHREQQVEANVVSPVNSCFQHGQITPFSTYDPRKVHRKQAIAKWLSKRERRIHSRKKAIKSLASQKKIIPKRSLKSGRFVKCTTSFVPITDLQSSSN